MNKLAKFETVYLPTEGASSLRACLDATFEGCRALGVRKVIIFTAIGTGPLIAVKDYLSKPENAGMQVIAVTPPAGRAYIADTRNEAPEIVHAGLAPDVRAKLKKAGVGVVSGRLPFKPILGPNGERADTWHAVEQALSVMGGGLPYCIQATLMACDAGHVVAGERVAAMSADTSIVAWATHSESFLSPRTGLIVDVMLCRPRVFDVSKPKHKRTQAQLEQESSQDSAPRPELNSPGEENVDPVSE